ELVRAGGGDSAAHHGRQEYGAEKFEFAIHLGLTSFALECVGLHGPAGAGAGARRSEVCLVSRRTIVGHWTPRIAIFALLSSAGKAGDTKPIATATFCAPFTA